MACSKLKGDVSWHHPHTISKKKKPIAYSSVSTSDLIVLLSKRHDTILDVYNAINYDAEAKEVLEKYIQLGYGNLIARELFK